MKKLIIAAAIALSSNSVIADGALKPQKGGVMAGNIEHSGGKFTSNGVQVDNHAHGSVQSGGSWTKGTQ